MKRRTFISSIAIATVAASHADLLASPALPETDPYEELIKSLQAIDPPTATIACFEKLMAWLKSNQWLAYIKELTNIDLDTDPAKWKSLLMQTFPQLPGEVFNDFAGNKLIEPGFPEFSLLYHILASPRIKPVVNGQPFKAAQYPSLEQLDQLENYIWGSVRYAIPDDSLQKDYAVAIFAYEYRPAFKTPDEAPYAGFVFSRTGIARIGEQPLNYDRVSRSFTNKPAAPEYIKQLAVCPARYGVFLCKKVPAKEVKAYSNEEKDKKVLFSNSGRYFLQPLQKVFDGDRITNGGTITYGESHRNEKLFRMQRFEGINVRGFDTSRPPFIKVSATDSAGKTLAIHRSNLVRLTKQGSSVLLASIPDKLVKPAVQDGRIVTFQAPVGTGKVNDLTSNRRYTSFRLQTKIGANAWDYIVTEGLYKKYKATRFSAPRNAPMFANIRHLVENGKISHLGPETDQFEEKVFHGDYACAMFEDDIADGCITASIQPGAGAPAVMAYKLKKCLAAFSLVAAPDFFPLSESYDILNFDETGSTAFLQGGIENLSYCRLPVNPATHNPFTGGQAFVYPPKLIAGAQYQSDKSTSFDDAAGLEFDVSDTMIAMVAGFRKPIVPPKDPKLFEYAERREYQSNNYLTDTAAFVFAPGWDATYSSDDSNIKFLATFGLGSPFPEDMKLCAAANGMWPVASPDAARTFMGSLDPSQTGIFSKQITPTAIPLLDEEIGIHPSHPGLTDQSAGLRENHGWDGEQGPCLEKVGDTFQINFTDIGRADYVWNLGPEGPGFDASLLRELTCQELIARMEALRLCKNTIEGKHPLFSHNWLISAEKVDDWRTARAIGVPLDLVGTNKEWVQKPQPGISGSGYIYILSETIYDKKYAKPEWVAIYSKRRRQKFKRIYVCQIAGNHLAWCSIDPQGLRDPAQLEWHHV